MDQTTFRSDDTQFGQQIANAQNGSAEQRAQLLETFRDYMRRIARQAIGDNVNGQMSASDIVQSAIIDAQAGLDQCRAKSTAEFKGWLKRVLINDILNRHRFLQQQKRNIKRENPLVGNEAIISKEATPTEMMIKKESEQRLLSGISKLPTEYQQVITLRHREHLSFQEIGVKLERSADAARMLWKRAIESLSKNLSDD